MKTLKLSDSLYWNGVLDPDLKVFDIVMTPEFGTTYNSYVLKGSRATALFETAKEVFWDEYKASLESLGVMGHIDYVIMNHTEPDHAGSIAKILELNPRATVVGTATAISFLKEIANKDFRNIAVADGDTLSLGDKTLQFMVLPNLHWPDTMYTYVVEEKALFPCDSFGSHYSHEGVLRSTVTDEEGYWRATKYYFDAIIGPFKDPYMLTALDRIKDLDIKLICPGHGPVHDCKIPELMQVYRGWCGSAAPKTAGKLVVIPYVSAYGYTGQLAEHIAAGIKDRCKDIEIRMYDMVTADAAQVGAELAQADGILMGTPTIIGEALAPIWQLTLGMFPPTHKGKLASAFGSYGWSGEGVPHIIERLKQLQMRVLDGFTVRLRPSETQLLDAHDFGYNFACALLKTAPEKSTTVSTGGKMLMKCLVCGEIFDASLGACPVCGVDLDKCVPVESTETTFRRDTMEKFVIIGGGAAAFNAADAIRARNRQAHVTLITNERYVPYNRPMLTKALLSDMSGNRLAVVGPDWYEINNINVVLETEVNNIDVYSKRVMTSKGAYDYDKLIYALGARCFVAPIQGADAPHVVSIRSIADTEKAKRLLKPGANVVCIGGGVMGLEAAWELKQGGYRVTVLEGAPGLLPKQLDEKASAMLEGIVAGCGIDVITGAGVSQITATDVKLNDGRSFAADLVIMSTGMRPNVSVAEAAGIKTENGFICVDAHMHTSTADIYACGDCVTYDGQPQAFWAQAAETGRIAGADAAGETLSYSPLSGSLSINAFNTAIFAVGTNGKDRPGEYTTSEFHDPKRRIYAKYFFLNSRLAGAILVGDTSRMAEITKAMEEGATQREFLEM